MRDTITVSLPKDLKRELDALTKEEGLTRSDLVRELVRTFLTVRRFRRLRMKLLAKASAQGVLTDQDVFDRVS